MKRGKPRDGRPEKVEASLVTARALIREAIPQQHIGSPGFGLCSGWQHLQECSCISPVLNHPMDSVGQAASVLTKYQWLMLQRPAPI
ncbi:hypothetical protein CRYUN_Cryun14cG0139300 [Craigia yunnanensis]